MRRILLLLCVAFVVVGYAIPCFFLPFGEYKKTEEVSENVTIEQSLSLTFDGKAKYKIDNVELEYYYKLKDGSIVLYLDKNKETEFTRLELTSFNKINGMTNQIGTFISIAFGIIAVVAIMLPYKKS